MLFQEQQLCLTKASKNVSASLFKAGMPGSGKPKGVRTGSSQMCQGNKFYIMFYFWGVWESPGEHTMEAVRGHSPSRAKTATHPTALHKNSTTRCFQIKGVSAVAWRCLFQSWCMFPYPHPHSHELLPGSPAHQATLARPKCPLCSNCSSALCISAPFNASSCF